jgi:hypothetical protein
MTKQKMIIVKKYTIKLSLVLVFTIVLLFTYGMLSHSMNMKRAQVTGIGKTMCTACHRDSNVYVALRGDKNRAAWNDPENAGLQNVHRGQGGKKVMCTVCHLTFYPEV